MEIFHSLILGIVQGITEFLPISSSGHLVAIPFLLGWPVHSLTFDVALHFGTVIALLLFFWQDWILIIKNGFSKIETKSQYPKNLLWQIMVASIPAGILGILVDKYVEKYFHQPVLLAINFFVFGILLWLADKKSRSDFKISDMKYKNSFLIGLAQSIALIPGISRSGITMIAARMTGLDRENSARFSFLIGMPAMIGAFLYKLKDLSGQNLDLSFWIGVIASAVVGYLAIKFLLDFLKKSDFAIFAWYRIAFAILILIVFFS